MIVELLSYRKELADHLRQNPVNVSHRGPWWVGHRCLTWTLLHGGDDVWAKPLMELVGSYGIKSRGRRVIQTQVGSAHAEARVDICLQESKKLGILSWYMGLSGVDSEVGMGYQEQPQPCNLTWGLDCGQWAHMNLSGDTWWEVPSWSLIPMALGRNLATVCGLKYNS